MYNISTNDYLKYLSLISSIPKQWKKALLTNNENNPVTYFQQFFMLNKPNKLLYRTHLKRNKQILNKAENKWNDSYPDIEWSKIYMIPFLCTIDTKLRAFQYKFLKRILPTNDFLNKCKIVSSSLCDLCNMHTETVIHLFWECQVSQNFWSQVSLFLQNNNINIQIDYKVIAFGTTNRTNSYVITNFILLMAKYFVYKCKINKSLPQIGNFISELKQRKQIESIIANTKNKITLHNNKWSNIKF